MGRNLHLDAEDVPRVSNSNGSQWAAGEDSESRAVRHGRAARTRRPAKRRFHDDTPSPRATTTIVRDEVDSRSQGGGGGGGGGGGPKRTRPVPAAPQTSGGVATLGTPVIAGGGTPTQASLVQLRTQFENIVKALQDPSSLVNGIYKRAQERLRSMITDAGLDLSSDRDQYVYNYALQVRCAQFSASLCMYSSIFEDWEIGIAGSPDLADYAPSKRAAK